MSTAQPRGGHGLATVRGRGYRTEQVDRFLEELSEDRDAAWERAARLTVLAGEMSAECAALRDVVSTLSPPTYESLGKGALDLLRLVEEEATSVREQAEEEARHAHDAAEAARRTLMDEARAAAHARRVGGDEHAEQLLERSRTDAGRVLGEAREEAGRVRDEAARELDAARRESEHTLAELEKDHRERFDTQEHELAEGEAGVDSRTAELTSYAEAMVDDARRALAETEEAARRRQEEADATAAELLAQARVREERIRLAAERELREHEVRREEIREHLAHVRSSLAALTGREVPETGTEDEPGPTAPDLPAPAPGDDQEPS
ncbi:cellulose-binding protein [Streptomyces sp. NPDC008238]